METDGTELEGQGLDAKAPGDTGGADPEPLAYIGGKLYGLVLGEAAGTSMDLRMYDPTSGLGLLQSVTVPALGSHLDVSAPLAPHAWMSTAVLFSAPADAPYLLLALGRGAPDLVKPEAASWLQGPEGIGSFGLHVLMDAQGLRTDLDLGYWYPDPIPDPLIPPQPSVAWRYRVRVPLSATLWAATWTVVAIDEQGDGMWFHLYPQLGPFGRCSFTATEQANVAPTAEPFGWVWADFSLQVVDAGGQALSGQALQVWPRTAPASWGVDTNGNYSDDQGLWTMNLPLDEPLRAQTIPWADCGLGSWFFGSLDFTPTDPPPAAPPVLHATETRGLSPCPTSGGKAGKAKKQGEPTSAAPRMKKAGRR